MSRSPEEIKNWENVLREGTFDLPEASWQRMENDMRAFLAAQAREAAQPKPVSLAQRLRSWFVLPAVRWGIGFASLGLIALAFVSKGAMTAHPEVFAWVPGQAIEAQGQAQWNWTEGRCRIQGVNSRLLLRQASANAIDIDLERGQATFQVEHRKPDESFSVRVGDCQVHVVGTTFTVGIDSLKQWVAVEEGRIRFASDRGSRFVAKGQSSTCRELGAGAGIAATDTQNLSPVVGVPETEAPHVAKAAAASVKPSAATEIVVPSCTSGDECITTLSAFVRAHGDHAAAGEIALRWARLAARKGDYRDALVAYGFAADRSGASSVARLEAYQTRVRGLGQAAQVADSLDRWIPGLSEGSATWREALMLRKDVARRTGDGESVKRIEAQLQSAARAESGGR